MRDKLVELQSEICALEGILADRKGKLKVLEQACDLTLVGNPLLITRAELCLLAIVVGELRHSQWLETLSEATSEVADRMKSLDIDVDLYELYIKLDGQARSELGLYDE